METGSNDIIVIAEIGNTHIGDIKRAKYLIKLAKESGADIVKLQKRNPHECVPENLKHKPHPRPEVSYGNTYLEHRLNIELSKEQMYELKKYSEEEIGIEWSTSIFDISSAKEMCELKPKKIKIPSCCNNNFDIISYIKNNFEGEIHISTGMSTPKEKEDIYNYLYSNNLLFRSVVYHCTSEYPCSFEHLYLNEIIDLVELYPKVGYSSHAYGIASEIAALTLGATYFERHFIDDRTFKHNDSAASLEPSGFSKMIRDLKNINKALKFKANLTEEELVQRDKLKIKY